jgi:hypothetical protein
MQLQCLVGNGPEVVTQRRFGVKGFETPCRDVCSPKLHSRTKRFQTMGIFSLALLHQAKPFAQHFTRVLVTTPGDQLLHQGGLVICEHDVACGHAYLRVDIIGR